MNFELARWWSQPRSARAGSIAALALGALAISCSGSRQNTRPVEMERVGTDKEREPAPHGPAPESPPRDKSARNVRLIAKMLRKVESVRGIRALHEVPGKTLSRHDLLERVRAHVAREVPDEAILNEGRTLKLLGFVPTEFDYKAETFKLLEAQLAGYYEPADKTMYLASDLEGELAAATLAHELVHALQDHHYDLASRSKYRKGGSDLSAATSAIAEGDATSAMMDVLMAPMGKSALEVPDALFSEQLMASMGGSKGADAPHAMRASLVAPYVYGTKFVHALRKDGGWKSVDLAWKSPPTTTEQILHVDKWKVHEPALDVPTPDAASAGAGFRCVDEDTFGELGTRLTLAEWIGSDEAAGAAEGWGGDRACLAQSGKAWTLGWHVRFDAEQKGHAKLAFDRIASALRKPGESIEYSASLRRGHVCIEREHEGPLAIAWQGADLAIVAGATTESEKGAWKSSSDCKRALGWATKTLSQKVPPPAPRAKKLTDDAGKPAPQPTDKPTPEPSRSKAEPPGAPKKL